MSDGIVMESGLSDEDAADIAKIVGEEYGVEWSDVGPMILALVRAGFACGAAREDDAGDAARFAWLAERFMGVDFAYNGGSVLLISIPENAKVSSNLRDTVDRNHHDPMRV
jgi:hypothetical protein